MSKEEDVGRFLMAIVHGVSGEKTLESALQRLVDLFSSTFDLWISAICSMHGDFVTFEEVWSVVPTSLGKGTQLPANLTPQVAELIDKIRNGTIVHARVTDHDLGLLGSTLRSEGGASWMAVPLWKDDKVVGIFAMLSSSSDAFDEIGEDFFRLLSKSISMPLTKFLKI